MWNIPPTPMAAEPGRLTSFAELDRRSSQVAKALQAKGVGPGDRAQVLPRAKDYVLGGKVKVAAVAG